MKTTTDFMKMKENEEAIAMATAYDYPSAKLAERAKVDLILVGDSLGMVQLGYESTISVTLEDMILHTKAVGRGAKDSFIITDMPFMTYHASVSETLQNAKRLVQEADADAVKLEGAGEVITMIDRLVAAGVPVVGHLGLTPQNVGVDGGYKVQGKDAESAKELLQDAQKVEQAGAFMLVLECVPNQLATFVADNVSIPVIGIGAGLDVDGQVLVYHDIIGYGFQHNPKFVKQFADVSETIESALQQYVSEVKTRDFPSENHTFTMKQEELQAFMGRSNK